MIASILALAMAAQAQETSPIIVEGQKPPAEDRKVCRTERETGSHMIRKVCRSANEQRQADVQASNKLKLGNRSTKAPDAFVPPPAE